MLASRVSMSVSVSLIIMNSFICSVNGRYECLVPGCDVMSSNCETRKTHLVDFHLYPSSFRVGKFIGVRREVNPSLLHCAS